MNGSFLPVIPSGQPPPGTRTNVLPLAALHLKAGWHPAPVHSFTLPLWYRGTYDEQETARERAVIFDRSFLGRFYVTGARAAEVLSRVLATDATRIPLRSIRRAIVCRTDGTVLDIPTLCHIEDGRWLVVSGPRAQTALHDAVAAAVRPDDDVVVRDRLPESVLLAVHGPEAATRLEAVIGQTIPGAVPPGEAHELLLGGYRALVVHQGPAESDTGEDAYSFLVSPEVGEHIWQSCVEADIEPAGLAAYDTMRLEAGIIEAPTETPSPASPAHAGLDGLVDFEGTDGTPRAFPGVDALRHARADHPAPERLLRGLRLDGPRLAKRGARVTEAGRPVAVGDPSDRIDVGACVNAAYSPALGTGIALAYLPTALDRVEVDTDGIAQPATVVALPFLEGPRGTVAR